MTFLNKGNLYSAISVLIVVSLFVFIAYAMAFATTLPDVYYSYSTDECVKVVNYGTEYTCDNLPNKFIHVWVE